jgi:hypothetical protein
MPLWRGANRTGVPRNLRVRFCRHEPSDHPSSPLPPARVLRSNGGELASQESVAIRMNCLPVRQVGHREPTGRHHETERSGSVRRPHPTSPAGTSAPMFLGIDPQPNQAAEAAPSRFWRAKSIARGGPPKFPHHRGMARSTACAALRSHHRELWLASAQCDSAANRHAPQRSESRRTAAACSLRLFALLAEPSQESGCTAQQTHLLTRRRRSSCSPPGPFCRRAPSGRNDPWTLYLPCSRCALPVGTSRRPPCP